MRLTGLELRNVKLIRELDLEFTRGGRPREWTVIVGENGTCKTTILQAIALAASGPTRANQLGDPASWVDRRGNAVTDHVAHLVADFESLDGRRVTSNLAVARGEAIFRGRSEWIGPPPQPNDDPIENVRSRNAPGWFVAGYGIDRRLSRSTGLERPDDPAFGRLQSLFGKGGILGTGFADHLPDPRPFARILREVLVRSGLLPLTTDLELRGRGGVSSATQLIEGQRFTFGRDDVAVKLPAVWMSQGYQAVIAWVADIVGQVFWEQGAPVTDSAKMTGLVLVDELDLHLHPRWQKDLVAVLKAVFPGLQFVATTHSPLVLNGLEADEIVRLVLDPHTLDVSAVAAEDEPPAVQTNSELLQNYFGVDQLFPNEAGEELRRYGLLAGNGARSDEEEGELVTLRQKLAERGIDPGWEPLPRTSP